MKNGFACTPGFLTAAFMALVAPLPDSAFGAESPMRFEKERTFQSERAYQQTIGRPFIVAEEGSLVFYDKMGRARRRVSLAKEREGYERRPIVTRNGAVIVRSTVGYEWMSVSLEVYGTDGELKTSIGVPSARFAVFPNGGSIILPLGHGRSQYTDFSGTLSIVDALGSPLSSHSVPTFGHYPHVVFSESGEFAAILAKGRLSDGKGAILILKSSGDAVGRFESDSWRPGSEDVSSRYPNEVVPLARIDEKNQVVVATGFEIPGLSRVLIAVDFGGNLMWKWPYRTNWKDCISTLIGEPAVARVLVAEHCEGLLELSELDIKSGGVVRQSSIKLEAGRTTHASGFAVSDSGQAVMNLSRIKSDGKPQHFSLLLGRSLDVLWRQDFPESALGELFLGPDGRVLLRQAGKVHAGRFSK